jgi:hypothetical protein
LLLAFDEAAGRANEAKSANMAAKPAMDARNHDERSQLWQLWHVFPTQFSAVGVTNEATAEARPDEIAK